MKIPKISMETAKKVVKTASTATAVVAPLVKDELTRKRKLEEEKRKQEQLYADQKHNGMVKIASVIFSLVGVALSILAIKQSKIILSIIGLLSVIAYIITFLYCLEIIEEKKKNTYKIVFLTGGILMVIVVTLLL